MLSSDKDFQVSGPDKSKTERISEAINDLRVVIDGLQVPDGQQDPQHFSQVMGTAARAGSIFLRKLVLGDRGERKTRLLDDAVMGSLEMRFQPLRKIPNNRCRTIRTAFGVRNGFLQITKIDEPGPVLPTQRLPLNQEVQFSIMWPLPGMSDWIGTPTDVKPWLIGPEQLFQTKSKRSMNCDNWLDQKVLVFDKTPVSLKHFIRNVVNKEGAHSVNSGTQNHQNKSKKKKRQAPLHLLNSIFLFRLQLPHIIVIETALYLYEQLLQEPSIGLQANGFSSIRPRLTCTHEQASSSHPNWLKFEGSMVMVFSSELQSAKYTIRPVGN